MPIYRYGYYETSDPYMSAAMDIFRDYPVTNVGNNYFVEEGVEDFINPDNILDLICDGNFMGRIKSSLYFQNYRRITTTIIEAYIYSFTREYQQKPFMIVCRNSEGIISAIKDAWVFSFNYTQDSHTPAAININADFQYNYIETNPRKICKRYLKQVTP